MAPNDDSSAAKSDRTVLVATTGSAAPAPDARSAKGEVLRGRWEITGLLGVGGMGTVYRARDRELDETVALKMMKKDALGPEMLERFRREVKLARRVSHRNVARLYELGEHDGERFFTMELVEGESLRALLDRVGALPMSRVVEIGVAIAQGLEAAHQVDVVHRDLKPDNVLCGLDGRIAITDFGIAASLERTGVAETTSFAGTPMYMAPEQVDRQAPITAKSDVYALGAVLFEMATGEPPFSGETPLATAVARLTQPPPDPRQKRASLPAAFAELVLACMTRKPEERLQSAALVEAGLLSLDPASALHTRVSLKPAAPDGSVLTINASTLAPPASFAPWSTRAAPSQRLAVLPLVNLGSEDDSYVADGLTDDLIDALSSLKQLRVISRGLTERWAGRRALDPREVGQALDAGVIASGTIRRQDDRQLAIALRLVTTADGIQVWSQRFVVPEGKLLQVNQDAASAIAAALALDGHKPESRLSDPVAVELYLRARSAYREFSPSSVAAACDLYDQALAMAPNDPLLLSGKAMGLARVIFFSGTRLPEAHETAKRALQVAPHSAEAHLAVGTVELQLGNSREALACALSAIHRSPSLAEAHQLAGRILAETGPADAALRALALAIELEPRIGLSHMSRAQVLANSGRWDEAYATVEEARVALCDHATFHVASARLASWRGDDERVRASVLALDQITESSGGFRVGMMLQHRALIDADVAAALLDDPAPVLAQGGQSIRRNLYIMQCMAELAALRDRHDQAIAFVDRAVESGLMDLLWFDGCPLLAPLRAYPRWAQLRPAVLARAEEVRELLPRNQR